MSISHRRRRRRSRRLYLSITSEQIVYICSNFKYHYAFKDSDLEIISQFSSTHFNSKRFMMTNQHEI